MSSQPLIDTSTLEALKDLGDDFIIELLTTYKEETPKLLILLQQAYADQNVEEFTRAAHSIKSASNSIGALQFGTLARELEMMGRAGDLTGAPGKVKELADNFVEVNNALEEMTHAQ